MIIFYFLLSKNCAILECFQARIQFHSFFSGEVCVLEAPLMLSRHLSTAGMLICARDQREFSIHSCDLSPAPPAPLVYFFPAGVLFSTENAKGTTLNMPCHAIPINKYAKQKQQVHQSEQQICHLNKKKYANQNTKYAISIQRVRQPKH